MKSLLSLVVCLWMCLVVFHVQAQTSCKRYAEGKKRASFASDKVDESSGIAPSYTHKGVWWTHNDSGGKPRIFAFDLTGKALGRFTLPNAVNVDWEDMAAGPCPDGSRCLYIADVGDNQRKRKDIVIYRIPEPKKLSSTDEKITTEPAAIFRLQYPDGPHNCETFFVHPKTRDLILVTKETNRTGVVFVLPGSAQPGSATLKKVATLKLSSGTLTGGDISPYGDQIILRTYSGGLLYAPGADGIPKDSNKLGDVKLPFTLQGEAIAYSTDGQSLVLTSEFKNAPIFQLTCLDAPSEPKVSEPTKEPVREVVQEKPQKEEPHVSVDAGSGEKTTVREAICDTLCSSDSGSHTEKKNPASEKPPETKPPTQGCGCSKGSGGSWSGLLLLLICGGFLCFSMRREQRHGDSNTRSC